MQRLLDMNPSIMVTEVQKINDASEVNWFVKGFVDCPLNDSKKSSNFSIRCEEKSFTCTLTATRGINDKIIINNIKNCKYMNELMTQSRKIYK